MKQSKISIGLFIVALTTLMVELLLIRIFDVILTPNMGYMIVTCALFAFGLAGIYRAIKPLPLDVDIHAPLALQTFLFALSILLILPVFNTLPFNYTKLNNDPIGQLFYFFGMYVCLILPFFFSGLVFTTLFSRFAGQIQKLYFWDLFGAGVGTIVLIPFLPIFGPGGTLFLAASMGALAAALFSNSRLWMWVYVGLAVVFTIFPLSKYPEIYDFKEHMPKRGVLQARAADLIEVTKWDPISKIDVVARKVEGKDTFGKKFVAYDGGSQNTVFSAFDGDIQNLRKKFDSGAYGSSMGPGDRLDIRRHWWRWGVLSSHYLKRDQDSDVLVIGSAGGQEIKAALIFGAGSVDGIELVGTVIELGKGKYAEYIGNLFTHPKVNVRKDEGRSFLRGSDKDYDIIQIFSNHTSSSIASGTGAMATTYLQTADAYEEYFSHLKKNGIMHVNHHVYPKMISTAALAWKNMGKEDFQKHVVVINLREGKDNLPTMLIKMEPWTESEVKELFALIDLTAAGDYYRLVENPLNPSESFLSADFYSGNMPTELLDSIPFRAAASTDNTAFFNFLRKHISKLEPNPALFLNEPTAEILNSQLFFSFLPMDVAHLFITGIMAILFSILFVFVPLRFSKAGKEKWPKRYATLLYFSCLGAGFIIIELVFVQIFMKLIGYPLYTFSTVFFALLVSAGVGSLYSSKAEITPENKWTYPFYGILITGIILYLTYPFLFSLGLMLDTLLRIAVAFVIIFPMGFFLGMPFPLGILAIKNMPAGAVAWAWSMNSLFTVAGGLASVILAIFLGFNVTLLVALGIYLLAFMLFRIMRTAVTDTVV